MIKYFLVDVWIHIDYPLAMDVLGRKLADISQDFMGFSLGLHPPNSKLNNRRCAEMPYQPF